MCKETRTECQEFDEDCVPVILECVVGMLLYLFPAHTVMAHACLQKRQQFTKNRQYDYINTIYILYVPYRQYMQTV